MDQFPAAKVAGIPVMAQLTGTSSRIHGAKESPSDRKLLLNRVRHKVCNNFVTRLLTFPLPYYTAATMGASWQTPDQKVFIEAHVLSYAQCAANKTRNAVFWPDFLDEWFKVWPVKPATDLIEEEEIE